MTIEEIQAQIAKEMKEARINTWCLSHGIDPSSITYVDGIICIPVGF
jgi:hypothetical protein